MLDQSDLSSNPKSRHWLELAEGVSILGAVGGSIAAVVSQQVLLVSLASVPLSVSLALNMVNRQRLQGKLAQEQLTAIAPLVLQQQQQDEALQTLSASLKLQQADVVKLVESSQQQQFSLGQLAEKSQEHEADLGRAAQKLIAFDHFAAHLRDDVPNAHSYTRIAEDESEALTSPQATALAGPNAGKAYYNRGLTYQRMGDMQAAVDDYTKAIHLMPTFAKAYHNRGVAISQLGDKQAAVSDLRAAAKFFFDQGDIASYQEAKDLSKELHNLPEAPLNIPAAKEPEEALVMDALFA
jgi:tetratricopeptide (TPR) repeat protein